MQFALCFLPVYANWAQRFNALLPPALAYHHGYGVRKIGSEAHLFAVRGTE